MSNPTTKWNFSISFLGQYKAEPQSYGVGVGHDSGYGRRMYQLGDVRRRNAAKVPTPIPLTCIVAPTRKML